MRRTFTLDAKTGQPTISERLFQEQVRKAAILTGWRYFHVWDSRRSPAGFPDCVLVHRTRGEVLFLELKTEKGKIRPEQQEWIDDLVVAGQQAHIVRPSDFEWLWVILKGEVRL